MWAEFKLLSVVKARHHRRSQTNEGTLIQIWKSPYMLVFIEKQHHENFAFLTLTIFELFAREVCKFLKE